MTEQPTINYAVNGEPQTTTDRTLTPTQIMDKAEIDPSQNYLVEIVGRERKSYQDKPNDPVHMHEGQKFVTVFVGTVPVS